MTDAGLKPDKTGNVGWAQSAIAASGEVPPVDVKIKTDIERGKQQLKVTNYDWKKPLPNAQVYVDQLKENYSRGVNEIPTYFQELARNQRYVTAWDIANAQLGAYYPGEQLGKTPEDEAYDKADPALQSVLNYKPSRPRIERTQVKSFSSPQVVTSGLTNGLLRQAADITGSYESDGAGGYEAVNQGGANDGHTVVGYSGPFGGLHKGKKLTDLTLSEVMNLQYDPGYGAMSMQEWLDTGKLHAVGRYQFIGSTLKGLVQRMGISGNEKFTPELQDRLFANLLKSGGQSQWVGLSNASPAEQALIRRARASL
jgi:hypothetical protein